MIESIAIDDIFVSTILTSASILRPEAHVDAVVDGIKVRLVVWLFYYLTHPI